MKKAYSKPEINFDSFGLQASFAAGCSIDTNFGVNVCGYTVANMTIFTSGNSGCKYTAQDGQFGICYYVPTAEHVIFSS